MWSSRPRYSGGWVRERTTSGLSRLHIMRAAEDSLTRLGTDYIDLYQIHGFDPLTPLEETLGALTDLVRQGKVRYIGCSNLAAWQIMKALGISAREHLEKFVTLQAYYSLAGRELEREIVPMLLDQKIGLLVWSPLAGGFLVGQVHARRRVGGGFAAQQIRVSAGESGENLRHHRSHAGDRGARSRRDGRADRAGVAAPSAGGDQRDYRREKSESVERQSGVGRREAGAADLEKLEKLSQLPPEYPGWMFGMQGSDRRPGQVRDWSQVHADEVNRVPNHGTVTE